MIQILRGANLKKAPYHDTTHLFATYFNREMSDLNIIFERCWNSKQRLNEDMKLLEGFFMSGVSIASSPTSVALLMCVKPGTFSNKT